MKSLKFEKFLTLRTSKGSSKKAQGISINAIIIAAIALIVLVVLVAIFTGRIGLWGQDLTTKSENTCSQVGGTCEPGADICPAGFQRAYGAKCPEGQMCCMPKAE